jgi:hypothetical protein
MKSHICFLFVCTLVALAAPSPVPAGDVAIPNTFQSGTPAVAAEVNANFTAVETAVDDNDGRIAALEALVAALQSRLEALETSQVMALNPYLSVDAASDPRGPLVQLAGVNLQIVNGLDDTESVNGLGNLIIGYDEANTLAHIACCSDGAYGDQASCEGAGEIWSHSHKSGSHYLVTGSWNNYSQYGGIVAGYQNFATSAYSTVTGGKRNTASGIQSSVSGGVNNTAGGSKSSVSGGDSNTAGGINSSVSGGYNNTAGGGTSSVSGGDGNTAGGYARSVSGGNGRSTTGLHDWRAGTLLEDN